MNAERVTAMARLACTLASLKGIGRQPTAR